MALSIKSTQADRLARELLDEVLDRVEIEIVPFDADQAAEAVIGWRRFGKGRHQQGSTSVTPTRSRNPAARTESPRPE